MSVASRRRRAVRTVLLVGEGDAEVGFLQHLKGLWVQRGSGVAVTIKNARGKGAGHVVDFARRQSVNAAYDVAAALLDTDTDWNDKTRMLARKVRVHVLPCEPCLEAVLLSMHRAPVVGRLPGQLKQDFAARFGVPAHDPSCWRHFGPDLVKQAQTGQPLLKTLCHVMTNASLPVDASRRT